MMPFFRLYVLVAASVISLSFFPSSNAAQEDDCVASGGTIVTGMCCKSVQDFPNTCAIGACGCSAENSYGVELCECPEGLCFDGTTCTSTPEPPTEPNVDDCVASGGTVVTGMCCTGVEAFPNTCLIGACGCSPDNSQEVKVCECPEGLCFDGTTCTSTPAPPTEYFTLDAVGGGCIGLNGGNADSGNGLKLLECVSGNNAIQWSLDDLGRFHSKVDPTVCMQAGRGQSVQDGSMMRIYLCSNSRFQQFDSATFGLDGPIKLVSEPSLCVVSRGVHRNINVDPIILKRCDGLDEDRAMGWKADNP